MPSNVDAVIADIEDTKEDLENYLRHEVRTAMEVVETDARILIESDADWQGNLARSLSTDSSFEDGRISVSVSTGTGLAPYAPFVEFGTGSRTEQHARVFRGTTPERYPPGFPYKAPDMSPGMIASIVEWVETKPIIPRNDITEKQLGYQIAATIAKKGTYAHPFMRPAWFQNELQVRQAARNAIRKAVR